MSKEIDTVAEAHEADAIPRKIDVHTNPQARNGCEDLPKRVSRKSVKAKSEAEWAYERLILYIQDFEEQLDDEQEIAMGFAGGDAGVLQIEGMGYFDPDIVTFYGTDEFGTRTQLIQHVSQLSVILQAMPKVAEVEEPRRIGFRLAQELDNA